MASVYKRRSKLWCRVRDEAGKWISKPTPYTVGEERKARRYVEAAQRKLDARRSAGDTT